MATIHDHGRSGGEDIQSKILASAKTGQKWGDRNSPLKPIHNATVRRQIDHQRILPAQIGV